MPRLIEKQVRYGAGKYGSGKGQFYCQRCGKLTMGEGELVISKSGENEIRICKECWKK